MPTTFDCFTFFNELDLLEIRLEALSSVIDCFVIAESTVTFRGAPKPLHFLENRSRFQKYLPRIRHIVVEDMPGGDSYEAGWRRETHQRNALERGLAGASDDDLVMYSDLDEIPRAEKVSEAVSLGSGLRIFKMRLFAYFANCEVPPGGYWWNGTAMCNYGLAKGRFERVMRKLPTRLQVAPGASLRKRISHRLMQFTQCEARGIRVRYVPEGGHHFSSFGGAEAVISKRNAHSEGAGQTAQAELTSLQAASTSIQLVKNIAQPLDPLVPAAFRHPKFSHLIAPCPHYFAKS